MLGPVDSKFKLFGSGQKPTAHQVDGTTHGANPLLKHRQRPKRKGVLLHNNTSSVKAHDISSGINAENKARVVYRPFSAVRERGKKTPVGLQKSNHSHVINKEKVSAKRSEGLSYRKQLLQQSNDRVNLVKRLIREETVGESDRAAVLPVPGNTVRAPVGDNGVLTINLHVLPPGNHSNASNTQRKSRNFQATGPTHLQDKSLSNFGTSRENFSPEGQRLESHASDHGTEATVGKDPNTDSRGIIESSGSILGHGENKDSGDGVVRKGVNSRYRTSVRDEAAGNAGKTSQLSGEESRLGIKQYAPVTESGQNFPLTQTSQFAIPSEGAVPLSLTETAGSDTPVNRRTEGKPGTTAVIKNYAFFPPPRSTNVIDGLSKYNTVGQKSKRTRTDPSFLLATRPENISPNTTGTRDVVKGSRGEIYRPTGILPVKDHRKIAFGTNKQGNSRNGSRRYPFGLDTGLPNINEEKLVDYLGGPRHHNPEESDSKIYESSEEDGDSSRLSFTVSVYSTSPDSSGSRMSKQATGQYTESDSPKERFVRRMNETFRRDYHRPRIEYPNNNTIQNRHTYHVDPRSRRTGYDGYSNRHPVQDARFQAYDQNPGHYYSDPELKPRRLRNPAHRTPDHLKPLSVKQQLWLRDPDMGDMPHAAPGPSSLPEEDFRSRRHTWRTGQQDRNNIDPSLYRQDYMADFVKESSTHPHQSRGREKESRRRSKPHKSRRRPERDQIKDYGSHSQKPYKATKDTAIGTTDVQYLIRKRLKPKGLGYAASDTSSQSESFRYHRDAPVSFRLPDIPQASTNQPAPTRTKRIKESEVQTDYVNLSDLEDESENISSPLTIAVQTDKILKSHNIPQTTQPDTPRSQNLDTHSQTEGAIQVKAVSVTPPIVRRSLTDTGIQTLAEPRTVSTQTVDEPRTVATSTDDLEPPETKLKKTPDQYRRRMTAPKVDHQLRDRLYHSEHRYKTVRDILDREGELETEQNKNNSNSFPTALQTAGDPEPQDDLGQGHHDDLDDALPGPAPDSYHGNKRDVLSDADLVRLEYGENYVVYLQTSDGAVIGPAKLEIEGIEIGLPVVTEHNTRLADQGKHIYIYSPTCS